MTHTLANGAQHHVNTMSCQFASVHRNLLSTQKLLLRMAEFWDDYLPICLETSGNLFFT
jgi:hypothetical protein